MTDLTALERSALEYILAGRHPVLVALRKQVAHARLARRETRSDGFACHFAVDERGRPVEPADFELGDVQADAPGVSNGIGFLLYVRGGRLSTLQGFTYLEPWPSEIRDFVLSYSDPLRAEELAKLGKPF